MAKAQACPRCRQYFNPKFSGMKWHGTLICSDCWVTEKLKFDGQNAPQANAVAPRKQEQHSVK